ncbi:hypothetical protein [Desmospora profundinema]|uniref:Uncharacterized protein n=1 Tax=Desmospora profundinema TaxID=1571184 RepID=A0ABU1IRE5_9BACL|nr:hypothetical protein [Desmospora profundinema]MDR6227367.1 hypothetical protein [Desmospora profundinema]
MSTLLDPHIIAATGAGIMALGMGGFFQKAKEQPKQSIFLHYLKPSLLILSGMLLLFTAF